MPAPFAAHLDVSTLIGSWPLAVSPNFTTPTLLPNTLSGQATILGIRRATSFAVSLKSFILRWDSSGPITVGFTADGDIDTVVAAINATAGISPNTIAYNDNGFLRFRSPTSGSTSYLRISSIAGSEGIFQELGLFAETVSVGGHIQQAQHVDPSRHVASPGQLGANWGEALNVDVFNRAVLQLGVNTDRAYGLLDKKKAGFRQEEVIVVPAGTVQLNAGSPDQGVYAGPNITPTTAQLREIVKVLDSNGNEYTKEVLEELFASEANWALSIEADTNKQLVTSVSGSVFSAGDVAANVYVELTGGASGVLSGLPLKIIEYRAANQVVVQNVNPATGAIVTMSGTATGRRVKVHIARAQVDGLYQDSALTTRVEQLTQILQAAATVTGIEKNNRVRAATASFVTNQVKPGDLVVWSGSTSTSPYSNNGNYRVSRVIDEKVIELLSDTFGPIYLNPNGADGTIQVKTDGDFWRAPYVKFAQPTSPNLAAGYGAVPGTGETIRLVYLVANTQRDELEADPVAIHPTVRYDQETSSSVQKALMRILGPSVTSFDQVLHGEEWNSLEKLDFRLDKEHYDFGRHSTIRPDVIDMFPEVSGTTWKLRSSTADDAGAGVNKFEFRDHLDVVKALLTNQGQMVLGAAATTSVSGFGTPVLDVNGVIRSGPTLGTFLSSAVTATATPGAAIQGNSKYFFRWNNGVDPKVDFSLSLAADTSYSAVKMGVYDDGTGAQVFNQQVWYRDGAVGFNLGAVVANDAAVGVPKTNVHVRARSATDTELLRLEGFSGAQETIGVGFKPLPGATRFGDVEVDFDTGAGNWNMNFVLEQEASNNSATGAYFRWVVDSTVPIMAATGGGLVFTGTLGPTNTGNVVRGLSWSSGPTSDLDNANLATAFNVYKLSATDYTLHRLKITTSLLSEGLTVDQFGGAAVGGDGDGVGTYKFFVHGKQKIEDAGATIGQLVVRSSTGSGIAGLLLQNPGSTTSVGVSCSPDGNSLDLWSTGLNVARIVRPLSFLGYQGRSYIFSDFSVDSGGEGAAGMLYSQGNVLQVSSVGNGSNMGGHISVSAYTDTVGDGQKFGIELMPVAWQDPGLIGRSRTRVLFIPSWKGSDVNRANNPGWAIASNALPGTTSADTWSAFSSSYTKSRFQYENLTSGYAVDAYGFDFAPAGAGLTWTRAVQVQDTNPKLRVFGNASADAYQLTGSPSKKHWISGGEFSPSLLDMTGAEADYGSNTPSGGSAYGGIKIQGTATNPTVSAIASLKLPQGAIITGAILYGTSNSTTNTKVGVLRQMHDLTGGGTFDSLVSAASPGGPNPNPFPVVPISPSATTSVPFTIPVDQNQTIDNNTYKYLVLIEVAASGATIDLSSVVITYSLPALEPQ